VKTSSLLRQIAGRWRITEMEMWDSDYFNMEVDAFIEFGSDGTGTFQFGLVRGWMDCRLTHRDDKPAVEWSWEGNDESDPATGRGWVILEGNRTITGRIFIHQGEDSSFRAEKKTGRRRSSGPHELKRKTQ